MGDKELMWALKNGDLDEVKTLLKKVRDWCGWGNGETHRAQLPCWSCCSLSGLYLSMYLWLTLFAKLSAKSFSCRSALCHILNKVLIFLKSIIISEYIRSWMWKDGVGVWWCISLLHTNQPFLVVFTQPGLARPLESDILPRANKLISTSPFRIHARAPLFIGKSLCAPAREVARWRNGLICICSPNRHDHLPTQTTYMEQEWFPKALAIKENSVLSE